MCILGYFATENYKWQIDRTQQDTTWHLSKGGTEWDNSPHRFQTGWCCATVTNQRILPRILGISDIYRWMVGPLWIYIYTFFLGWGQEITGKTLFFLIFLFPTVNIAWGCVYLAVNETSFLFLNIFFNQTPLWLSLNSLDNNISTWYFPFEIVNICHLLAIILSSKTGWLDAHTLLNTTYNVIWR